MGILCLVRNASTEGQDSYYSGLYDFPLSEDGIAEADELGIKLKDIPFNYVFTSRLSSSVSTAQLILQQNLFKPKLTREYEDLNERNFGKIEGETFVIVDKYWGHIVEAWFTSIHSAPPAGESLFGVYNRVVPFWKKNVEPLLTENNIMIVAHYHVLQAISCYIDDEKMEKMPNYHFMNVDSVMYEF